MRVLYPYILPRPFNGYNIPGAIQSNYLKNYSASKNFEFHLPIVEITTSESFYLLKGFFNKNKTSNIEISVVSLFVFPIYDRNLLLELFSEYTEFKILIHGVLEGKIFSILELLDWAENIRSINNHTYTYNDEYLKIIKSKL